MRIRLFWRCAMFRTITAVVMAAVAALAFMPGTAWATAYASSILEVTKGSFSGGGFGGFFSFDFRLNQISSTLNGTTVDSGGTVTSQVAGASLDQPVTLINTGGTCVSFVGCGSFLNNA